MFITIFLVFFLNYHTFKVGMIKTLQRPLYTVAMNNKCKVIAVLIMEHKLGSIKNFSQNKMNSGITEVKICNKNYGKIISSMEIQMKQTN